MKHESPLQKLKKLVGESEEIRKGNLSGKKKDMAKKMKGKFTRQGIRLLSKREQEEKMKGWPKMSEKEADKFLKKGMGQSHLNNLPPGYSERDFE